MASLLSLFHRESRKRLWSEYESDARFDEAIESDDGRYAMPPKRLKMNLPLDLRRTPSERSNRRPVSVAINYRMSSTADSHFRCEPLPSLQNMSISGRPRPKPFDFASMLKRLTADYDRRQEIREFASLSKAIERLQINLSPRQIEEIV